MHWNKEMGESASDFEKWLFNSNKHYIRNLLLLYIVGYLLFAILDFHSTAISFNRLFNIRISIGIPALIIALICSYIYKLQSKLRLINASAILIMNLTISLMYAGLSPESNGFYTFFSGLLIALATLGISMSSIAITITYIGLSALSFVAVSFFIHHLHIQDPLLFYKSSSYILVASILFIVAAVVIERFSVKLYKAQKNISQEKDQISSQKDVLENLNETKDRFFTIISHDLRSPFTSLIGYFDILLKSEKKEYKVNKSDIQTIYLHARRTYNLLNNLLNWTKTQLNQYNFDPKRYKVADIFKENQSLYREIALQKEITITHTFPKDQRVYCDKEMITTIVRNLIFNAIKFTKPKGEIFLKATPLSEKEIELAVIDTGIGISTKDINNILHPNIHYTQKGTHNEKGAGIGLIICNDLLKKHNTNLQIESKRNVGSKFFFILPTAPESNN